jgi:ATP-dependent RNA helicase SUPV3L1/SUV3
MAASPSREQSLAPNAAGDELSLAAEDDGIDFGPPSKPGGRLQANCPGFLFLPSSATTQSRFAARIAPWPRAALSFSPTLFDIPVTQASVSKTHDTQALDALTGGAFTAPTSGERAARVRDWLAANPSTEQMQEVFRELSGRDKGAARLLRERLDEIKRSKGQEAMALEWAEKARALTALSKINIADALAWQRDAAKAGAPLSREPLASLKAALADRVKGIEDLQHRVQVQREAAVLLAQRIEVLSTKSWRDAQASAAALQNDVPDWQAQAEALQADSNWASVDVRFPPLLEASRSQLQAVWDAFRSAVGQAEAAAADAAAPLPPVPVWADELRQARGLPSEAAPKPAAKPRVDPELRARATAAVSESLARLEQEIAQGHGKASAGAASALRSALKENGKLVDDKLENQAHAALAAAGEMEGWQRWRADQLRQELVARAEALFEQAPAPVAAPAAPAVEGQEPAVPAAETPAAPARKPRYGGRKMQEQLRALREQWKQTDQGGPPNHALWKRFDEACNEAHKVVESWLEKVKAEAAEHRGQRLALIEELKAWAADNATAKDGDWKGFNRILHQFSDRWRDAGHLSEKAFAELQPLWKDAIHAAAAPLEALQKQSLERRHAMIDEARELGAQPQLRIDAVKALQQRWQAEAQTVPLDRKHEQKLWDAFRKPIDEAFNRKSEERDKAAAQLSERDRTVLEASKALEAANASGDAPKIRAAMAGLEAALRGQAQAAEAVARADEAARTQVRDAGMEPAAAPVGEADASTEGASPDAADGASDAPDAAGPSGAEASAAPAPVAAPPKPAPKPVVAMRGDDRPGMKRAEPMAPGRGGKFGDRKGPGGGAGGGGRFGEPRRDDRGPRAEGRFGDRPAFEDRGPRLGDVAFRAQREALEHAQSALKKLAAQAHGEALTQLMTAWEQRSGEQVPSLQELGKAVPAPVRSSWVQSVGAAPSGAAAEALLRLEIAAEAPTPAEHLSARRLLQLQLLTRRNEASPNQTWGQDTAKVLATAHDASVARRLQTALKTLLRG